MGLQIHKLNLVDAEQNPLLRCAQSDQPQCGTRRSVWTFPVSGTQVARSEVECRANPWLQRGKLKLDLLCCRVHECQVSRPKNLFVLCVCKVRSRISRYKQCCTVNLCCLCGGDPGIEIVFCFHHVCVRAWQVVWLCLERGEALHVLYVKFI